MIGYLSFRAKRRILRIRIDIPAPKNAPIVFNTKSVNSKKPTCKTNWRHSMQSEKPKAVKVASPIRRQESVEFNDTKKSAKKNPNGTKMAMLEKISIGPCSFSWYLLDKSSARFCPVPCFIIPKYRIPTAVSSRNRPMKTVSPKAIAPYTEHFFRTTRITVNADDITPITAQCVQGTWERM